jgi:peptidoglycan/xylan/chitin deacetylase (PgdA/CDA1 family)
VVAALEAHVDAARDRFDLAPLAVYRARYAHANRWDPPEVIFVKRMLQKGLPEALRAEVTDALFRTFVASDEAAFAQELYVSLEQLRCMHRHGMHVGSHSHDHVWLDQLTQPEQEAQVVASLDFLRQVGVDPQSWTMAYPYGGYDASLEAVLARHGCRAALTTDLATADLDSHRPLALPRIDTNDLPTRADAEPTPWSCSA